MPPHGGGGGGQEIIEGITFPRIHIRAIGEVTMDEGGRIRHEMTSPREESSSRPTTWLGIVNGDGTAS